ncbi:aromatic-ring-hydroxylating dioxygenase subunit beta [Actinophytocola sp.]|uniref:aromatic-ring-hydroxylating dioxygenase subunit beta n=1 Tax=Actinophytocola sp. TaxID=1872138 RepID=UPI002ED858B1
MTTTQVATGVTLDEWWQAYQLYTDYTELLDTRRLDDWIHLFEDTCLYRVMSAENQRAGLPLALMRCEGVPGLRDRVHAINEVSVYGARIMRHVVSGLRVTRSTEGGPDYQATASFVVTQSLEGEQTTLYASGVYEDRLTATGGRLRFAEKTAVYDGSLITNSMVYPL